jgi:hypothetical protein
MSTPPNPVSTTWDPATISALAAWGATTIAAIVAGVQFYIGRTQSQAALALAQAALMTAHNVGRHRIAAFREEWITEH